MASKYNTVFPCKKEEVDERVSTKESPAVKAFKKEFLFKTGGKYHMKVPVIENPQILIDWLESNI